MGSSWGEVWGWGADGWEVEKMISGECLRFAWIQEP